MNWLKTVGAGVVFSIAAIYLWDEWHSLTPEVKRDHKEFLIASYNVENLFDLHKSGKEYDVYEPFTHNWTPTTHTIKLEHTAQVIKDINASIIALQEIESPLALHELLITLKNNGITYPYYALSTGEANIKQALLSRYKIISQQTIFPPRPTLHTRGILHVVVDIKGTLVSLFVNHWRSKKGSEEERIATAQTLMKILKDYHNKEYILLGDFNSNYDEYRTSPQKTAINHELKTVSEKGRLVSKNDLMLGEEGHTNLWLDLPESERMSTTFAGKNGSIDAIILPATLFDHKGIDYVDRSFHAFKPSYLLHNGQPKRWKITKQGKGDHKGEGYSDHLPVVASFSTHGFIPTTFNPLPIAIKTTSYILASPDGPVYANLQKGTIIYTNNDMAIIKDRSGSSLPLNDPLGILKEGHNVDILIKRVSTVNNKKFGWDISLQNDNGFDRTYQRLWHKKPMIPLESPHLSWEVITQTPLIYSQGRIYYNGKSLPVRFGSKNIKPPNKTKLMIHRGVIGSLERRKLLVEERRDFTIIR